MNDRTLHPVCREDLEESVVVDDLALFDPVKFCAITLNRTGRAIWELCNGSRNQSAIVDALLESFEGDRARNEDEVDKLVAYLVEQGALTLRGS